MTGRLTRSAIVPALLAAIAVLPAPPAHASALAGACPDEDGVTVVVDFQELGGPTIVSCARGPQQTGVAALKDAGIAVTGTTRWGEAFICRIEGKPGPDTESCIDTPPATAYWSYWHAPNGGSWTYSQQGAAYRTPPPGSFEGWSFALDRTATGAPQPRVAPRRPAPPPPPRVEQDPPADPSGEDPPAGGNDRDAGSPVRPPADPSTGPDASPSSTPLVRATAPTTAGTTDRASRPPSTPSNLDGAAPRSSSTAPVGTLVGLGLLLALAAAVVVTAWRRRRATDD